MLMAVIIVILLLLKHELQNITDLKTKLSKVCKLISSHLITILECQLHCTRFAVITNNLQISVPYSRNEMYLSFTLQLHVGCAPVLCISLILESRLKDQPTSRTHCSHSRGEITIAEPQKGSESFSLEGAHNTSTQFFWPRLLG